MTYPPLAEIRQDFNVQWYRSPLDPEKFRELSKRSDLKGWFQAGGHLAMFVATGSLVFVSWSMKIWLLFFAALFFHGTVASFFSQRVLKTVPCPSS